MAGFDPDVFGQSQQSSQGFDADVFNVTSTPRAAMAPAQRPASRPASVPLFSMDRVRQEVGTLGDLAAGGVKGASNIGATLLTPVDWLARKAGIDNSFIGRDDRRQSSTEALQGMGADTDSNAFKGGELAAEIAGSSGVGGVLAKGVRALPMIGTAGKAIATGLETGGFRVPGMSGIPAALTRAGTGATAGALSAGLVDPDQAFTGMAIGGVLPGATQIAGKAGQYVGDAMRSGSKALMQSAIKPTLRQLKSGDAATAVDVLLERGLNPNARGVAKLEAAIDDVDNSITQSIAGSTARVDKQSVADRLNQTRQQFRTQAVPQNDLAAIEAARDNFLGHPMFPLPQTSIPVQQAQDIKRGTYQVLGKKYGEMKGAETEAQKALARGLKEEIAAAVPGVNDLNTELGRLMVAKEVAERRALMEGNKNPFGLAALSPSKAGLLTFLADRSAQLKGLTARGMYSAAPLGRGLSLLDDPALLPYVRGGLLSNEANR